MRFILFLLVAAGIGWWVYYPHEKKHPPGILVDAEPELAVSDQKTWQGEGYRITALASYQLNARVLSKAHYYHGRESEFSTTDLALGWKEMSDTAVLSKLHIDQFDRYYDYRWEGTPPIPESSIPFKSGNMHIIPGNVLVGKTLDKIVKGDLIWLKGYLVTVQANDGWNWTSSTSSNAQGPHGCKLIWVEEMAIMP